MLFIFFFNDPATTEIYTLSLHDALPILSRPARRRASPSGPEPARAGLVLCRFMPQASRPKERSEEHTSELQSRPHLVCRLLLEKKKKQLHKSVADPHSYTIPTQNKPTHA